MRTSLIMDCNSSTLMIGHEWTETMAARATATESAKRSPFLMLGPPQNTD